MSTRMDDTLPIQPAESVNISLNKDFDAGVHRWHEKYPKLGTGPVSIEPMVSKNGLRLNETIFTKNVGSTSEPLMPFQILAIISCTRLPLPKHRLS